MSLREVSLMAWRLKLCRPANDTYFICTVLGLRVEARSRILISYGLKGGRPLRSIMALLVKPQRGPDDLLHFGFLRYETPPTLLRNNISLGSDRVGPRGSHSGLQLCHYHRTWTPGSWETSPTGGEVHLLGHGLTRWLSCSCSLAGVQANCAYPHGTRVFSRQKGTQGRKV